MVAMTSPRGMTWIGVCGCIGGGSDRNMEANTLLAMIDYIHHNPVRRGLVQQATEWKWSSAGWFAGGQPNSLRPDPIDVTLLPAG
jgi:hypothetical protein